MRTLVTHIFLPFYYLGRDIPALQGIKIGITAIYLHLIYIYIYIYIYIQNF